MSMHFLWEINCLRELTTIVNAQSLLRSLLDTSLSSLTLIYVMVLQMCLSSSSVWGLME
jgi:hypothetical protein